MKCKVGALFTALLLMAFTEAAFGQDKLYIGYEAGIRLTYSQCADNGFYVRTPIKLNAFRGFRFGYEFKPNFFLETGIYRSHFDNFANFQSTFDSKKFGQVSSQFNPWQVPLRLKHRYRLKERFFWTASLGGVFLFGMRPYVSPRLGPGSQSRTTEAGLKDEVVATRTNSDLTKHAFLVETGLGLD